MEAVGKEIAEKEVNAWLDFQGISSSQREAFSPSIQRITEAVMAGYVVINTTDWTITQKLRFPFGEKTLITSLTFKPSLTVGEVQDAKIGLDQENLLSNTFAHLSAATGELCVILFRMNNKDFKLSDAIILFFMV